MPRPRSFTEYRLFLASDLYRYGGVHGWWRGLLAYLRRPGFRYTFWLRTAAYLSHILWLRSLYYVAALQRSRYSIKYGIQISHETNVGPGLYIGHFGTIVVNDQAVIGSNCNLSHDVTVGQVNRGSRKGCPVIGDNVYVGPGARLLGQISVGSNVAIGANCVLITDVEDQSVVVGIPGRVVSKNGVAGYIRWTLDVCSSVEATCVPETSAAK